jgi:hypothetical protein
VGLTFIVAVSYGAEIEVINIHLNAMGIQKDISAVLTPFGG